MFRIIPILFIIFFSSNIMAIDFSGSYFGVKCKGNPKCVDGDFGTGLLGNFKLNINSKNTITELSYIPDVIVDGFYFINIQLPHFVCDAAPSRPLLYKID